MNGVIGVIGFIDLNEKLNLNFSYLGLIDE